MRLLRLEMRGFGAFRNITELTFDDADFFVLVGPTGSGKSTVLDAVCFALYGSVPRYDDAGLIHPVIALGALEAKVRLDFEVGGDHFIVARTVQRTAKGAKTKEARLERVIAGDETEPRASGGPQVTGAVVRLLGLRFEDFTRCVALPQGDFAQFLRGDAEKRRGLMLRLLNLGVYMRMGAAARQLEAGARNQIELIDRQLKDFAFATEEALQTARSRLSDVNQLSSDVEAAQPILADLTEKEQAARRRANEARAAVESLQTVGIPGGVEQMATDRRDAIGALETAETAENEAITARKGAEADRRELPPLAPLEKARNAHEELVRCENEIAGAKTTLEQEQAEAAQRQEALKEANSTAEQAAAALLALERQHLARSLSENLVAGDPCPVCEQTVEHLPGHEPLAELSDARRKQTDTKQEAERREQALRRTENTIAGINGGLEKLARQRKELVEQLTDHPDRAALDVLIEQVETAEATLSAARTAEGKAIEARQVAKKRLDALDEADRKARGIYSAQRERVIALGPPPTEGRDVLDDWRNLADWAESQIPEQSNAVDAANEDAALRAGERNKVMAGFDTRLEELGIGLPTRTDLVALVSTVATAAGTAAHEVTTIEAAMADAGKLEEERAGLDEERAVAKLLGKLLEADEFPQWLVQEAMAVLTVDASRILRELTGGQFSLVFGENEFVVVDHANADERRPARTLSGGETFQASLALALALSEQLRTIAAEGAPRLDAIFLDEGFGTLDPETLDVVAATIENLGQSGRMVGIVTHVSELASRVPVRFQVTKGLGSSVVEKKYA